MQIEDANIPILADFNWTNLDLYLETLAEYLKDNSTSSKFFLLVQIDSLIESYLLSILKTLINKEQIAEEILLKILKDFKLTPELILSLNRERVTLSEFIVKGMSFSNLDSILSLFDKITDNAFSKYLKSNIENFNAVFMSVSNLFKLRNELSHKIVNDTLFNLYEVDQIFQNGKTFIKTCDSFFITYFNLNPMRGRTTYEMDEDISKEIKKGEDNINSFFDKLIKSDTFVHDMSRIGEERFLAIKQQTSDFINKLCETLANRFEGGTILPIIYGHTKVALQDECLILLKHMFGEHYRFFENEPKAH